MEWTVERTITDSVEVLAETREEAEKKARTEPVDWAWAEVEITNTIVRKTTR